MTLEKLAFDLGRNIAAAAHGLRGEDLPFLRGQSSAITSEPGHEVLMRKMAACAAGWYKAAGLEDHLGHGVYSSIARSPWHHGYEHFMRPVFRVMGDMAAGEERLKTAAGNVFSDSKDAVTSMLGMAGLIGVLGGGGAWYFNRDVMQDEDKAEAVKAQIAYYRRVVDQLNQELAADPSLVKDQPRLRGKAQDISETNREFTDKQIDRAERREQGESATDAFAF